MTMTHAEGSGQAGPLSVLSGKRCLVVEDNEINQKLVTYVLEDAGMVVLKARDGFQAIEQIRKNGAGTCDIILMDLHMPVMDGYETTVCIRQELRLSIPIVAMTACVVKEEEDKCRELGMNDYLSKPFEFGDLYERILRLLKPYDLSPLEQLGDSRQLLEILEMFLANTPEMISQLSLAVRENDWGSVKELAHKGKSSAGLFRAHELTRVLAQMESKAKSGKETHLISGHLQELISVWLTLETLLTAEKQSLKEYIL